MCSPFVLTQKEQKVKTRISVDPLSFAVHCRPEMFPTLRVFPQFRLRLAFPRNKRVPQPAIQASSISYSFGQYLSTSSCLIDTSLTVKYLANSFHAVSSMVSISMFTSIESSFSEYSFANFSVRSS